jgi:DNA replication and repair protein RecF
LKLLSLSYSNFRNITSVELQPSPHATIAVGQNGQGKTNLLEGLYFLATLKPLRASKLSELVRFEQPGCTVSGKFLLNGAERNISVDITGSTRTARVDGKKAANLETYFGGVNVVAFTPDDLSVVKGSPEGRRNFFDRTVFNRFPAFLDESREYTRAVKSRNRLLKINAPHNQVAAFDSVLARTGARIYSRRRSVLAELKPRILNSFEHIGRTVLPPDFRYTPAKLSIDFEQATEAQMETALLAALDARLVADVERGFTSVGPHADDVEIVLGENSARSFASQGQSRALVLAWKIGEIENLHALNGFLPLLLLDDVSSELDPERNAFLMKYLADSGAQTFLTTTDASLVKAAASADTRWYSVSNGTASELIP